MSSFGMKRRYLPYLNTYHCVMWRFVVDVTVIVVDVDFFKIVISVFRTCIPRFNAFPLNSTWCFGSSVSFFLFCSIGYHFYDGFNTLSKLLITFYYRLKILREVKTQSDELIKTGMTENELRKWKCEIIKAAQGICYLFYFCYHFFNLTFIYF